MCVKYYLLSKIKTVVRAGLLACWWGGSGGRVGVGACLSAGASRLVVHGPLFCHSALKLDLQTARSPEKQLLLMVNYILIANSASHYFTLQVLNSKPMFTPTKLLSRLHVDTWVGSGFMCQSLCPGCRLGGAMELSSTCFFMGSTTLWCVRGWWAWLVDV